MIVGLGTYWQFSGPLTHIFLRLVATSHSSEIHLVKQIM